MNAHGAPPRGARPRALLVPMMDLPAAFEVETNLWYDYDHIPDRLSCEGVESCQRLQLSDITPAGWEPDQRWVKYLHVYDLDRIEVLDSPAYKLQKTMNGGRGSHWRQQREARQNAVGAIRDRALRASFVQRTPLCTGPATVTLPSPRVTLVHLRHDLGDMDEAVNDFVDDVLVPELIGMPGVLAVERFEAAAQTYAKAVPSTDQFRHPRYLDFVDVTTPEVLQSGIFRRYVESLGAVDAELMRAWRPAGSGIYVERPSPWRLSPVR